MRKTKIVATLGPATEDPATIRALIEAGVDVFRLNLAHGAREGHAARIRRVRDLSPDPAIGPAVLADLQGPKLRLGSFEAGAVTLGAGAEFALTTLPVAGSAAVASVNYEGFARDVRPGDTVLLADGAVTLRVESTDGVTVRCRVLSGGRISDRKGINLPGARLNLPALTEKDLADLRAIVAAGADLVSLSFVRRASDVVALRRRLEELGARLPIVAKIEKPEALEHLEEILEQADGVMVARGDLGVELALEKVPHAQKRILREARRRARFAITATQMLESMVENPYPTRAEVSDVANAIYDGTDAVMLSAETSVGRYPVEAVRMMARIAGETELTLHKQGPAGEGPPPSSDAQILAEIAIRAARGAGVAAVAVFTVSGSTARLLAAHRPPVPIYAFTPEPALARQLAPVFGVRVVLAPMLGSVDEMLACLDRTLLERGWLQPGQRVVFVAGQPLGRPGTTNLMKLHVLGS